MLVQGWLIEIIEERVGVVLINHNNKDFEINEGDRIAQMILE